jgi:ferredoxin-like protein FixX
MSEAVFINVEVAQDIRDDGEMAKKLEEACPVDIYAASDGSVEVVEENLDECILCGRSSAEAGGGYRAA